LFCLVSLLYLACFFLSKNTKKIVPFIVLFLLVCLSLAKMSIPEFEVCSFKQQGGESLKDAWYIISNACHRCTTNILP
jgi:hypothetical protein